MPDTHTQNGTSWLDRLRRLPIEAYVILVPAFSAILIVTFFFRDTALVMGVAELTSPEGIAHSIDVLGGGTWFAYVFQGAAFITLTHLFRTVYRSIQTFPAFHDSFRSVCMTEKGFIASLLWIALLFTAINLSIGIFTHFLFMHADPVRAGAVSSYLLETEYGMFGVYPHLAIASALSVWPLLDTLIVLSYQNLPLAIFFVLIPALFLGRIYIVRWFLLSFFIVYLIAVPIWILSPAVSPLEFQIENTLHVSQTDASVRAAALFREQGLGETGNRYIEQLKKFWIDPSGKTFAITCNPSMHTAFAIVLLAVAYRIRFLLGVLMTPWFILCILGTVYTLQHYLTDVVTGGLVAAAALTLAAWFLRLDARYIVRSERFYVAALVFKADMAKVASAMRRFLGVR